MSDRDGRTVTVTGPTHDMDRWVEAAESAGWKALARPLIEIRNIHIDLVDLIDGLPDWICLTSSSALPSLGDAARRMPELLTARFACVGDRTQERASALGFKASMPPSPDGQALANRLLDSLDPGSRILWPHGSLSSRLGDDLERAGHSVLAPVVYETVPVESDAPPGGPADGGGPAHALLLASPSGVRAYVDRIRSGEDPIPVAIAIGTTTAQALDEYASMFENVGVLERPTPESFAQHLRTLESPHHDP